MEQHTRFLDFEGRRIAYSVSGAGPPIVVGPTRVGILEAEWADPLQVAFYADLARRNRVIRFDRIGSGLSSRELDPLPTIVSESRQLEAVIDAVGGPAVVFATSCCCLAASQLAIRSPERVAKLVYFGSYAARDDIPQATRSSLIEFVRTNWPLGAQLLAGLFDPHASGDEIAAYTRAQRHATSAEAAAIFLELELSGDVRSALPRVNVPALVLHRRGDRVVPLGRGRELARLLPNARFVPLGGDSHLPWRGDRREVLRALAGFLLSDPVDEPAAGSPLTSRETEVLRLVSTGLNNREIASILVLSEHTVHRHVANILRKLVQPSRAAAATQAARAGLI